MEISRNNCFPKITCNESSLMLENVQNETLNGSLTYKVPMAWASTLSTFLSVGSRCLVRGSDSSCILSTSVLLKPRTQSDEAIGESLIFATINCISMVDC